MSLGIIPSLETPTYAELRDRESAEWYQPGMRKALSGKLKDANKEYSLRRKLWSDVVGIGDNLFRIGVQLIRKRKKDR